MTFWAGECGALRARPRVCVWGDSWAYWLASIREGERAGDHLSPPPLLPFPHSRSKLQTSVSPSEGGEEKKREHGTMPHVRDVRKPKHSSALMYLIWFIKLQFAISVESSVSVKRENKRAQLNRRQEKQSPRLESVATGLETARRSLGRCQFPYLKNVILA